MNCYECAKTAGRETAVALCPDCSAGLCLRHVRAAAAWAAADGSRIGCGHDTWLLPAPAEPAPAPGLGAPAGAA